MLGLLDCDAVTMGLRLPDALGEWVVLGDAAFEGLWESVWVMVWDDDSVTLPLCVTLVASDEL